MLRSYSIIVPAFNKQEDVARTLRSVGNSMAFFDAVHPRAGEIRGEIIVVDDGSTDGTVEVVQEYARTDPRLRLIRHHRSHGPGAARNAGMRASSGDVLFYCDADDLYFREHVVVGFSLLDGSEGAVPGSSVTIQLPIGGRGPATLSVDNPVAAIRTGVHIRDPILPYWKAAISHSITQNLCVRRECHEWNEGFPEEAVYGRIRGSEDTAFNILLDTFFRVGQIELETVEYLRSPGNSFDRQFERFQHPPDSAFDIPSAAQQALDDIRMQREDERIGYLLKKWRVLGPPPLPPALLNWDVVLAVLLQRQQVAEAHEVAEQARQLGYDLPADLAGEIANGNEL